MNSKPLINSFIYRKPIKYGYKYIAVNLYNDSSFELDKDVEPFITSDNEIVLTNITQLEENRYRISPIHRNKIPTPIAPVDVLYNGIEISAHKLSTDDLITVAFTAAKIFCDMRKELEKSESH